LELPIRTSPSPLIVPPSTEWLLVFVLSFSMAVLDSSLP
jgi:hypothetical protein